MIKESNLDMYTVFGVLQSKTMSPLHLNCMFFTFGSTFSHSKDIQISKNYSYSAGKIMRIRLKIHIILTLNRTKNTKKKKHSYIHSDRIFNINSQNRKCFYIYAETYINPQVITCGYAHIQYRHCVFVTKESTEQQSFMRK